MNLSNCKKFIEEYENLCKKYGLQFDVNCHSVVLAFREYDIERLEESIKEMATMYSDEQIFNYLQ